MDAIQVKLGARGVKSGIALTICLISIVSSGCCLHRNKRSWCDPNLATPLTAYQLSDSERYPASQWDGVPYLGNLPSPTQFLYTAESTYALACMHVDESPAASIDEFFSTIQYSWPLVEEYVNHGQRSAISERAWQLYHSSVAQIIQLGQQTGRLDVQRGLLVRSPGGVQHVDVHIHGGVWTHADFCELHLVGDYVTPELSAAARQTGVGVPLVVTGPESPPHPWLQRRSTFAATALLRPLFNQGNVCWALEFYDPLRSQGPFPPSCRVAMAYDLTAPFAYKINHSERDYLTNFLQPGASTANRGLFMIEPYQPGKIPVVFVHGLLSDPVTWADVANVLRHQPDLRQQYQIWAFEYPTGDDFFQSAARLRSQLTAIRSGLDPDHHDVALDRMVIVGHSMGGLLAQLQVTCSGDTVWRSFAKRPFPTLTMSPSMAQMLSQNYFFKPVPYVSRVVFIGTPHRGSALATCCIGRIGNALVEEPPAITAAFETLNNDNPGAFTEDMQDHAPRSIEMLEPDNPLLNALAVLPISPHVTLHSIIGTGRYMLGHGPSDGVVPVSSAQQPGVASELLVDATHEELHRQPECVAEILRILREHARMTTHLP